VPSGASCGSWFGPKSWLDGLGSALVKLVHRSIEQCAAGMFFLAIAPVLTPRRFVLNTNLAAPRSGLCLDLPLPGACSTT
jgi:hypothetical protein